MCCLGQMASSGRDPDPSQIFQQLLDKIQEQTDAHAATIRQLETLQASVAELQGRINNGQPTESQVGQGGNPEVRVEIEERPKPSPELVSQFRKSKPESFLGKHDLDRAIKWMHHIERIFKTLTATLEEKVALVEMQLEDKAEFWWQCAERH